MPVTDKTPYEIQSIPEGAPHGWTLTIDGEIIEAKRFTLINERFGGAFEYGLRPEGYDGVVIRERGGAVTLPYMVTPEGRILVGLVDEYRPTTGGQSTLNAPRGMAALGETREQTALRELEEETGCSYSQQLGMHVIKLAEDVNANTTYFDTSRPENEGTAFYALAVPSEHLELRYDDDGTPFYAFPSRTVKKAQDAATERIFGSRFVPLHVAPGSKDMFTGYAVGQLLGKILEGGNYIVPQVQSMQTTSV